MITKGQIIQGLQAVAEAIAENKDYLTELDAAIGDADHGINLDRGFQAVLNQLPNVSDRDLGSIFKHVSMTLISSVGGASGPLYGTMFLRASSVAAGKEELNAEAMGAVLVAFVEAIVLRGKAQLGDKTLLDVLIPTQQAYQSAIAQGSDFPTAWQTALEAAKTGRDSTIPLVAKKGRASYLGDRACGHLDPGAASAYLILKTLFDPNL
ncbi:MAG: dihydroxyacetone kinase subunit L [Desertifilum sp. SIO1I2]|nr:dihydroxyacetone kinase subunit L [Desertifilum sp. SIO1I2]